MSSGIRGQLTSKYGELVRGGLAELLGTGILVLFGCGSCTFGNKEMIALTFGLVIMCMATSLGHVSGCHLNPAVTLGLLLNGQVEWLNAIVYVIGQFVGAVVGAGILAAILDTDHLCPTGLNAMITPFAGIVIETILTFVLILVICNVCESNPTMAPLAIGLTVATGHLFAIELSGSSMNPARSFGPALIGNIWKDHYVYWVGPLIGGALAGLTHRFFFFNSKLSKRGEAGPKSSAQPQETTNV
ncbi:unnamed protein product [Oppiella nova]|uniref:Aquaporin n=1 Tax=Oppiella nova TaxID=334625 RepID=A0A7R9LYB7_9ACAR|nr:unnamed protein product [Oppiella nova]CAG2168099.1 unnamed protein product [Oppiella nova]